MVFQKKSLVAKSLTSEIAALSFEGGRRDRLLLRGPAPSRGSKQSILYLLPRTVRFVDETGLRCLVDCEDLAVRSWSSEDVELSSVWDGESQTFDEG
jgi:hypothetical protein